MLFPPGRSWGNFQFLGSGCGAEKSAVAWDDSSEHSSSQLAFATVRSSNLFFFHSLSPSQSISRNPVLQLSSASSFVLHMSTYNVPGLLRDIARRSRCRSPLDLCSACLSSLPNFITINPSRQYNNRAAKPSPLAMKSQFVEIRHPPLVDPPPSHLPPANRLANMHPLQDPCCLKPLCFASADRISLSALPAARSNRGINPPGLFSYHDPFTCSHSPSSNHDHQALKKNVSRKATDSNRPIDPKRHSNKNQALGPNTLNPTITS